MSRRASPILILIVIVLAGCGIAALGESKRQRYTEKEVQSEFDQRQSPDLYVIDPKRPEELPPINVQAFLSKYGYLKPGSFAKGNIDDATSKAIKEYQEFFSLEQTGKFDPPTRNQAAAFRCGNPDRAIEAATACPWHGDKMRYVFKVFSSQVPKADCQSAIRSAFNTWEPHLPFKFVEVQLEEQADLVIEWVQHADGDYSMAKNCSAHSDWPADCCYICSASKRLPMHFNERDCKFVVGKENGKFDIETVALHETGHVIGMMHSTVRDAVMYPNVEPGSLKRVLSKDDLQGVQELYPGRH